MGDQEMQLCLEMALKLYQFPKKQGSSRPRFEPRGLNLVENKTMVFSRLTTIHPQIMVPILSLITRKYSEWIVHCLRVRPIGEQQEEWQDLIVVKTTWATPFKAIRDVELKLPVLKTKNSDRCVWIETRHLLLSLEALPLKQLTVLSLRECLISLRSPSGMLLMLLASNNI